MILRPISGLLLAAALAATCAAEEQASLTGDASPDAAVLKRLIESHCLDCHDKTAKTAGLALDELSSAPRTSAETRRFGRRLFAS